MTYRFDVETAQFAEHIQKYLAKYGEEAYIWRSGSEYPNGRILDVPFRWGEYVREEARKLGTKIK